MSNIVEFPTKLVQDWVVIERSLRDVLNSTDASNEFVDLIIERMQASYKEHQLDYQLSFNLPENYAENVLSALTDFSKALQQRTNELMLSRLILEIKLAKAEGYQ